jgi:hypothetical protein
MGKLLRALCGLTLVVATAGCWPAPGAGPDRRSHNPAEDRITAATAVALDVAWTAPLDHGAAGPPVVSTAGVHVNDVQAVYGFDARTGARRWKAPEVPETFAGAYPTVAVGGRLIVARGDTGSRIHATEWVDAATGEAGAVLGAGHVDAVRGSRLLLRSVSYGSLTPVGVGFGVVDLDGGPAGNGGLLEVGDTGAGAGLPLTLGSRLVVHAGVAVPGPPGSEEPTEWTPGVRGFGLAARPADCGPPIAPYFACPEWATPTDARPVGPAVLSADESTIYAGTGAGTLYALAAADGRVLWRTSLGAAPSAAPALAGGTLYVPLADGRLVTVAAGGCGASASTCPVGWGAELDGAGLQPAVAGTGGSAVVLVGTSAGTVEAVAAGGCGAAASACPVLWSHDVGSAVTGAPAVTGGRVYVGTEAGELVAFAPS